MLTLRRPEIALSHVILLVSPGDDSLTAGRDILTGNRSVVTRAQMRLKDRTRSGVDWLDIHVRDINLNAVMKAKIHIKGAIEIPEVLFRNFRGSWGCTFYI